MYCICILFFCLIVTIVQYKKSTVTKLMMKHSTYYITSYNTEISAHVWSEFDKLTWLLLS